MGQRAPSPLLVRTCAYLVAGHVVILLDDINLVQEAGRKRCTRVTTCSCHFAHPLFLPLCKDQLMEMITSQLHGIKSVGIVLCSLSLWFQAYALERLKQREYKINVLGWAVVGLGIQELGVGSPGLVLILKGWFCADQSADWFCAIW